MEKKELAMNLTMRHVRWAAQECFWQQSGEPSVAWMMEGWEYATVMHGPFTLEDVLVLGRLVEPRTNQGGLRQVNVRVGYDVKMPHASVPAAIEQWVNDLSDMNPTEAFRQYEEIHPFRDGNGRTGSIWFNLLSGTLDRPIHPPNLWDDRRRLHEGYPNPDRLAHEQQLDTPDVPMVAIGHSQPLPAGLPPGIAEILREKRAAAGYCDHGKKFAQCGICA